MPGSRSFRRAWAVLVAAIGLFQAATFVVDFDLGVSLPLHICRLTWVAVVLALWTLRPLPVALTFFWGGLLSSQALLTPSLAEDFPDPRFLAFWALHLMEVAAAVYLVGVLRLAPRWRDLVTTVAATLLWAAVAMTFNGLAGTNYGYLQRKPDGSVLDLLGPWPWYLAAELVIVIAIWALMTLAARWWSGRSPRRPVEEP
ncbi:hypothetical protein GCM10022242_37140 [Nocardioides panacisoli]|uniref:TIGR02206 family membrane protein n=1 Tax=Nocardioides panacisoli TaxID=627624 RepID=A0ABP7J2W3_9ACTN